MRFEDWPERLNSKLQESKDKPFEWGDHDCCLFAADVALELTGIDYADTFRNKYSNAVEAMFLLKPYGGIEGYVTSRLGGSINVAMAQRGDVVTTETEYGIALGVCNGLLSAFVSPSGLVWYETLECLNAWRVA